MKITPSYNEFLGKFMCRYEVRIGTSNLRKGAFRILELRKNLSN